MYTGKSRNKNIRNSAKSVDLKAIFNIQRLSIMLNAVSGNFLLSLAKTLSMLYFFCRYEKKLIRLVALSVSSGD
jgi:hypothetical protein